MRHRSLSLILLSTISLVTILTMSLLTALLNAAEPNTENQSGGEFHSLFDGTTLAGWDGDSEVFRVEDASIIGGQLSKKIPHNYFLSSQEEYADFELTLEFKLIGESTNAGVQLRSKRIPDHHEMIGYQADLGQNYWGALYDESRRNKVLIAPDRNELAKVLKPGDWNSYRILCEGRHIQLWINGFQTVDYSEDDETIEQSGLIALQIHGGPPGESHYRNIQIRKIGK
jgi:hypothetical protein